MISRWALVLAAGMSAAGAAHDVGQTPAATRQATPARDAAAQPPATAIVRGKVTAAATGQPLHRVRITLSGTLPNPPTAVTDTRGMFELTEVPAGTFSVTAVRAGYLTVQYGQRRPREAGRTLKVENGQIIEGIDIALPRGGVLAGRVTDELGEPSPGTRVEAVEFRYLHGRRVAVPARITSTNDVGEYRLAGLEPGPYQVRASTRDVWEADDGQTTYTYAVTYFPGVTAADRPQNISVATGQQVTGVDFHLVPGRAARITGVVEDANGVPLAGQVVHLSEIGRTIGGALLSSGPGGTTKTDANGAFDFPKLWPGEYLVYAGGPNDTTAVTVVVASGDARHVVVTPRKPTTAVGTVVTDEGAAPPFPAARLGVMPVSTDPERVLPEWGAAREQTPKADWTFRIPSMDGLYLFRVTGLPDEWMLKSVLFGRRDITDTPLAVRRGGADTQGVQIVLTRKAARLAGDVKDASGAAAPATTVIVFGEDRATWGVGSRFIRAVRPDRVGRFSIGGLPPGIYRAIAVDVVVDGQWEDPEFLQSLFRQATKVELADGASERVTLTLEAVR